MRSTKGVVVVFVDRSRIPYGRMKMCHMVASTHNELIDMADRIGVDRKWIQKEGTPEEHFDICLSKRDLALKEGAVYADRRLFVSIIQGKRRKR